MAPEENKGKSIEELMAEVSRELEGAETGNGQGQKTVSLQGRDDIPPWEDDISDAPAADLFPALSGPSDGPGGAHAPLPPPTPDRDKDGYDRNNWSRLLRQARDMRPEIAEYLETLYKTGIGLELKKYKTREKEGPRKGQVRVDAKGNPVIIEKFKFTPGKDGEVSGNGNNPNWTDDRIKEIMSALYTYMAYLPARKELGQDNVVVQAMEAAIRAGGLLAVNSESGGGRGGEGQVSRGGLKFDWSRADTEERKRGVEAARKLMDRCGAEIMQYIRLAERRLRDIGFVVSLAEMSDCVEDFN